MENQKQIKNKPKNNSRCRVLQVISFYSHDWVVETLWSP